MRTSDTQSVPATIDFHVHAFPDHVAENAIAALSSAYNISPVTDGTVSGLQRVMSRDGVKHSVIMPVATKPEQVRSINDWAVSQNQPGIICFGGIHPDYDDIPDEIDRIVASGLKGIKIQANWQGTFVDDPRMYEIYESARGRLIITFHAGKEAMPVEPLRATPDLLANVHKDFPDLTMIAAHMGGFRMWDDVERCLTGKDVYFDTSACFDSLISDERMLKMIRAHGAERVLFGTDNPLAEPGKEIARLARIGLTDDELELILCRNADRLLGM